MQAAQATLVAGEPRDGALGFRPQAGQPGDDYDVLMCYHLFLGRNPENSFVIEEAKTQPIESMIRSFLQSQEFAGSVLRPLREGRRLPHAELAPVPSAQQIAWLDGQLDMDEAQRAALREMREWEALVEFLARFATVLPRPAEPTPELPLSEVAAGATTPPQDNAAVASCSSAGAIAGLHVRLERVEALLRALQAQLTTQAAPPAVPTESGPDRVEPEVVPRRRAAGGRVRGRGAEQDLQP